MVLIPILEKCTRVVDEYTSSVDLHFEVRVGGLQCNATTCTGRPPGSTTAVLVTQKVAH